MRVRVVAVGERMPAWVDEVCADYIRRLGSKLKVSLIEIGAGPRGRGGAGTQAVGIEGERILAELRPADYVVALDERGRELSSRELADWLGERMQAGRDPVFTIGGPDGLAASVLERSDFTWSLSRLTLPHALVRVLLTEQLYRAHTLLSGHPYHRA
jgi:23S rRNA (pseudouridine1915-N3)-methyltransferase